MSLGDFRRLCILKGESYSTTASQCIPYSPRTDDQASILENPLTENEPTKALLLQHPSTTTKTYSTSCTNPSSSNLENTKLSPRSSLELSVAANTVLRRIWRRQSLSQGSIILSKSGVFALHVMAEAGLIGRYPTFTLALQDLQDPLNLIHLFSTLPTKPIPGKEPVQSEVINECGRLISELKVRHANAFTETALIFQVWAIKTHALRKVFLGIKGIHYEISVPGHAGESIPVRWLEGYEFQQFVPTDVDFRILLTFLELYRTLVGFVLFRLYTQENLVYPPPIDSRAEEDGEGLGAVKLVDKTIEGAVGNVSRKAVRRAIEGMKGTQEAGDVAMDEAETDDQDPTMIASTGEAEADEFVERPAAGPSEDVTSAPLTSYATLVHSQPAPKLLFADYTFYLSRETSQRTWEFVIRASGGRITTALETLSITHVLIDRPMTLERRREMEAGRKWVWVQPQWVADCVNGSKVLGSEGYGPGELLPPHLSPWDGDSEVIRPWLEGTQAAAALVEDADVGAPVPEDDGDEDEDEEDDDDATDEPATKAFPPALLAAAQAPTDSTLLHAAELEAESSGTPHATFQSQLKEASKTAKPSSAPKASGADGDLRKIMMSNKKAKLYEKMQYGNKAKAEEVSSSRKSIRRYLA